MPYHNIYQDNHENPTSNMAQLPNDVYFIDLKSIKFHIKALIEIVHQLIIYGFMYQIMRLEEVPWMSYTCLLITLIHINCISYNKKKYIG